MKPKHILRPFLLLAGSSLLAISSASGQQAGTWDFNGDGNWSDTTKWTSGLVANGATFAANFTGANLTANRVVTLDTARTIGGITFTDATSSTHNLTISGANTLTVSNGGGNASVNVTQAARTLTISSVIDGTVGINKTGPGTLVLSAANTYAGVSALIAGTVRISTIPDSGIASPLGTNLLTRLGENANSGTLDYVGAGDSSNRRFIIGDNSTDSARTGGGRINSNGTGLLEFTEPTFFNNSQTAATATRTLTLGGANNGKINGVIRNNNTAGTAPVALTKEDSGTWSLGGANTYTGATDVNAGTLNLTGNRTAASGAITVSATGTLGISNGTFSTGNILVQSGGTFGISNGSLSLGANTLTLGGASGTSTVNHTGGTISTGTGGNQILIGNGNNSTGIYNLSGGELNTGWTGGLGARGVILGVQTNSTATFNLSGTGNLNMTGTSSGLQIGRSDGKHDNTTNVFNQTGGTATVPYLRMGGFTAGSTGVNSTLSITGGTFTVTVFDRLALGDTNTAKIEIGGTADVTLPAFPSGALGAGSTATLEFDGGVLKNRAASTNYLGNISSAQIKAGGAKFNTAAGNITIVQDLLTHGTSTGGGLTKEGANTLTLNGANTYTGTTAVNGGILQLDGSTHAGSAVSISSTGTLAGTGTVNGTLDVSGTLAPGNAGAFDIETLAAGATTWNSGSIWNFDLSSSDTTSDRLDITGNLTKGGSGTYQFNFMGSTPAWNTTYTLVDWSGTTDFVLGDFSFTNLGAGPYGASSFAFNGSSLTFTAVPEPTSALAGLLLTAGLLRRRRKA